MNTNTRWARICEHGTCMNRATVCIFVESEDGSEIPGTGEFYCPRHAHSIMQSQPEGWNVRWCERDEMVVSEAKGG